MQEIYNMQLNTLCAVLQGMRAYLLLSVYAEFSGCGVKYIYALPLLICVWKEEREG